MRQKGLGRGLEVLLGAPAQVISALNQEGQLHTLDVEKICTGKYQPRTHMDEGALQELASSIRTQGIMQPILVREIKPELYEIIAGERRYRAAKIAGLKQVPVLIKKVPDQAVAAMALIENIQRENLNPLEEARGIQRLIEEFNFNHEKASEAVGRSRSAVSNLLRLLNLAAPVQTMLLAGDLDMGHARALLAVDSASQINLANQVISRGLSVRETEKLVSQQSAPPTARSQHTPSRDQASLQEELADLLGLTVQIQANAKGKGRLTIQFNNLDELDGVLRRLRSGNTKKAS